MSSWLILIIVYAVIEVILAIFRVIDSQELIISIIICVLVFCFFHFGIGKTKVKDLSFTEGTRDMILVTKKDKIYSGNFWSDDRKTIKFTTDNRGIIKTITFFHPNGREAAIYSLEDDGYFEWIKFYNENGKSMDRQEFDRKYTDYFESVVERFFPEILK